MDFGHYFPGGARLRATIQNNYEYRVLLTISYCLFQSNRASRFNIPRGSEAKVCSSTVLVTNCTKYVSILSS